MKLFNNKNICLLIFALLTILPVGMKAQNDLQNQTIQKVLSTYAQQEKVYIHTDRNYYNAGEAISFKIYLTDIALSLSGAKSKVTYVELINSENKIVDSKKIALANGMGIGHFKLNRYLEKGNYLIRASTKLLQQDKEEYFFRKTVFINSMRKKPKETLVATNLGNSINNKIGSEDRSKKSLITTTLLKEKSLLKILGESTSTNQVLKEGLLIAFAKGKVVWKEIIKSDAFDFEVPLSKLPNGLIQFLILDSSGELIEDSILFNTYSSDSINADVSASKEIYTKKEAVSLLLELYDNEGVPIIADLSVAVIEKQYVTNFSTSSDISSHLLFDDYSNIYNSTNPTNLSSDFIKVPKKHQWKELLNKTTSLPLYTPELGLSIKGYVTEKGNTNKPVAAIGYLSTLQSDFSMHPFETNEQGQFSIEGLSFDGEIDFFIQAAKSNKKKKAKIQSIDKMVLLGNRNVAIHVYEAPASGTQQDSIFLSASKINFLKEEMPPPIIPQASTLSVWDGSLSVEIEEVTVTAKRIDEVIAHYEEGMLYKAPDTRITTESMPVEQYNNIYSIIAGRVPGMELARPEIEGHQKSVILRGRVTGFSKVAEMYNGARFMVNGAFVNHIYAESIPPRNIAFVDVIRSLHKLGVYGELGVNGLIMIYLKPPPPKASNKKTTVDGVLNFTTKGYDKVEDMALNASNTEKNTPTIYWNPILKTDRFGEAVIEFPTLNKAGIYEVFIEGISKKGLPIVAKTKIVVE